MHASVLKTVKRLLPILLIAGNAILLLLTALFAIPSGKRLTAIFLLALALILDCLALLAFRLQKQRMLQLLLLLDLENLTDPQTLCRIEPSLAPVFQHLHTLLLEQDTPNVAYRQLNFLALQEQINPHFLYNALESVRGKAICSGEYEISDMIEALGNFFRYLISNRKPIVTLESELENIDTYFRIQRFRFGDRYRLELHYDTDAHELRQYILPKLTLQPLIENAIMHGLETKPQDGLISIDITTTASRLIITIRDNGCGIPEPKLEHINDSLAQPFSRKPSGDMSAPHRIGIKNVNQRLKMVFGNLYGIHLTSIEGVGTDVILTLPKLTQSDIGNDFPLRRKQEDSAYA